MNLNSVHVKKAYLYLKSYAYHENLNLFLKQRVGRFEEENELDEVFDLVARVLNGPYVSKNELFCDWLKKINFHLLPKKVKEKEQSKVNNDCGLFFSNVKDSNSYRVSKVNYFINAPIEIHLIEILWCIFAAPALELVLSGDCYGNRLHSSILKLGINANKNGGNEVFKRYIEQYNQWRDRAVDKATEISQDGENVALLALDIQEFFYNVNVDFNSILNCIEDYYRDEHAYYDIARNLTVALRSIYERYNKAIDSSIMITHEKCKTNIKPPIGFASSAIISNWYLSEFDQQISDIIRPAYYGRYVDDIILVIKRPVFADDDPVTTFIQNYLASVISFNEEEDCYYIDAENGTLPIQKEKVILQYYDKKHSRAGLEIFKQELEERSSAFKFLPSDHIENDLDKFAYDILYDGSANKIRSVVGLSENETELSKYLSSHITANRLCSLNKKTKVLPQIKSFFRGENALRFYRLWEKIYQYSIILNEFSFTRDFNSYLKELISTTIYELDLEVFTNSITESLRHDLLEFNDISLSLVLGLLDITNPNTRELSASNSDKGRVFKNSKGKIDDYIVYRSHIHNLAWDFRRANLIRHNLVSWPLLNYSDFDGDLTNLSDLFKYPGLSIDLEMVYLSPRFIHFDEWQLFQLIDFIQNDKPNRQWIKNSIDDYTSIFDWDDFPLTYEEVQSDIQNIKKYKLSVGEPESTSNIKIALANIKIPLSDIKQAVVTPLKPNISFNRQQILYQNLNMVVKEKAELLVMPEVSIPVSWLPFMVSFSRRHQIGIVFGLEHWIEGKVAYNLIIECLPFKISNKYKSCVITARIKNHYAPAELKLLSDYRLNPANKTNKFEPYYHKVSWKGISFATYNCFELSDINHRVLFKSEIDLLIACVWNKDTNYYQHILESTVRDLHCYTVQSNTSQYGGSCVLRPAKTENKTMLYVKGGGNSCVLTVDLDIKGLRAFQYKSHPDNKDIFKHLPPGFNNDNAFNR